MSQTEGFMKSSCNQVFRVKSKIFLRGLILQLSLMNIFALK